MTKAKTLAASTLAKKNQKLAHTAARLHVCAHCGKAFAQRSALVVHMRTHSGQMPYVCRLCSRGFLQKCSLDDHVRRAHTHERPYACNDCGKAFVAGFELAAHRRKHTGERPYGCRDCPATFSHLRTLINHTRTHTGDKPFACSVCPLAFATVGTMRRHARSIHQPNASKRKTKVGAPKAKTKKAVAANAVRCAGVVKRPEKPVALIPDEVEPELSLVDSVSTGRTFAVVGPDEVTTDAEENQNFADGQNVNATSSVSGRQSLTAAVSECSAAKTFGSRNKTWTLDDFDVEKEPLGDGSYGTVYVATEQESKCVVALKVLSMPHLRKHNAELLLHREIGNQSRLSHPNVIGLYGHFYHGTKVYLILEYASRGALFEELERCGGKFDEKRAATYIRDLASALQHCHLHQIIHRDLKPENLLLDSKGRVKIADFGWSVNAHLSSRKTLCGTPNYVPPEMIAHNEHDEMVDNWSLGVVLYQFLCGELPFEAEDRSETYRRISKLDYSFPPDFPEDARGLVQQLLVVDPKKRLPLSEVINHKWIKEHCSSG